MSKEFIAILIVLGTLQLLFLIIGYIQSRDWASFRKWLEYSGDIGVIAYLLLYAELALIGLLLCFRSIYALL